MPGELIPSFISKINRAEKHLGELEGAVDSYAVTHPYEVGHRMEGKKKVPILHFTALPINTDIPLIAGDISQNIHAGLHHLAVLLAARNRGSIMFPIFWQGVWNDSIPGENKQRADDRQRWNTYTRDMRPQAVTILKELQPPDGGGDPSEIHKLLLLSRLSNTDRHKKLNAVATGLTQVEATITRENGEQIEVVDAQPRFGIVKDGATIHLEPGEVDVEIRGTPAVVIGVTEPEGEIVIPGGFQRLIEWVREKVTGPLTPYVFP
jgi:hypothetical protein